MKCYLHQESDAIGVCASCGKAICKHCVNDDGKKLLCTSPECNRKKSIPTKNKIFGTIAIIIALMLLIASIETLTQRQRSVYDFLIGLSLLPSSGVVALGAAFLFRKR